LLASRTTFPIPEQQALLLGSVMVTWEGESIFRTPSRLKLNAVHSARDLYDRIA
jgi:hypothetical protein